MKKLLLLFATAIFATAPAIADEIVCSFDAAKWSKGSAYAGTLTSNDQKWKAVKAANNNGGWNYIKIGGKNSSTVGEIQSLQALEYAIEEVAVNITAIANGSITGMDLYISDDATFDANDTKISAAAPTTAEAVKFAIPEPAADKYYCVKISVKNTTKNNNGVASIDKVTFTYSNSGPVLEDAGLSFPAQAYTTTLGETFDSPVLTKNTDAEPVFESSNPEVATVDENSGIVSVVGIGTTTIKATTIATETFKAGKAEYTLTVKRPSSGNEATVEMTYSSFDVEEGTTTYGNYTFTDDLGIEYKANMAAGNNSIQLRSKNSESGIVVTANKEGYVLRSITVDWNNNTAAARVLDVYGNNAAYTNAADLYDTETRGEKLGSINYSSTASTLSIDSEYSFIGLRSNDGAMYINKITLVWEKVATAPESAKVYFHGTTDEVGESIDLGGSEKKVHFAAAEGVNIFVRFEPDSATEAQADGTEYDGFEPYNGEGFTLNVAGTLKHYTEKGGLKSPVSSINVTGNVTAINEIDAAAKVNAEWFDLQGRRVASPVKGRVYIVKEGSTTSKRAL
ncbi:MAG: hypothetical protein K2I28_07060 [Muribaculaceae bacterium]|nr:hypothetical protein [Muribaculaceae bacterium]